MDEENNPYAALPLGPVVLDRPAAQRRRLRINATTVFLANLPLPGIMGWMLTWPRGMIGLVPAVAGLFALGYWTCAHAPAIARALIVGGALVGLAQLMFLPHFFVGIIAVEAAHALTHPGVHFDADDPIDNPLTALLATAFTGGMLMLVALALGVPIRMAMVGAGARQEI